MQAKTNAAMLIHPTVTQAITGVLRSYGVRRSEIDEGVAEVQTRTLEYLKDKPHPTAVEEWAAVCATIAKNWRINENKKRKTEKKYCAGLCEDPDEHTALERAGETHERVDAKRMVEVLRQQFEAGEMPEKGDEILDCMQAGMDYQETAEELGISAEAVRKRLLRMRKLFTARLGTLGIAVTAQMFLMGCAAPSMPAVGAEPTAPEPTVTLPPPRPTLQTVAA
jgi:RNA polymerase sigma factor (sigma-70 family)